MKYSAATILAIAVLMAIVLGCSSNPVTPSDGSVLTGHESAETSLSSVSHHNLGYWIISVDTETMDVEPAPLRTADWHFNLTGILNGTMGISAAPVPGESDPMNGLFVLDITLTHPFATKTQFSGFDVKGILMTPGTLELGPFVFADADETELENADGYTRWWNSTEFPKPGVFGYTGGNIATAAPGALTATVNPYKYFADILGPIAGIEYVSDEPLDSDEGRGVFTAGSANTRRYEIRFPVDPGPQIVFGYAIDCSWDLPSPNPPGEVPDDFPIEANQPEPYRIAVIPTANSLYYDNESGTGGGILKLQINVHDWQGQVAGDIPGEVSEVRILAPDLMASAVDGVFLNETTIKARYTADLAGLATPSHSGDTKIICRVGSTDGSTYRQAIPPAPEESLSAFHAITLDIPDPECGIDTCNDFNEALDLDLENPTVDQLCAPDDYRDFFALDIPLGYSISGNLTLYCDAEPTKFGLYDDTETLITEADVSGGIATLDLGALGIMPGSYYLRILTQTSGQAFLYMIEPNLDLTDQTPHGVNVTPDTLYWAPYWVQAHGNYVVGSGNYGMEVYDWTSLHEPQFLCHVNFLTYSQPALAWPYMYIGDSQDPTSLRLIDLTDPSNPVVHENILTFSAQAGPFLAEPGYLYAAVQPDEIEIYDISTPTAPTLAGSFTPGFIPYDWTLVYDGLSDAYWLAMDQHSNILHFFNVSDKESIGNPQFISWMAGSVIWDVAAIENYCFCVESENSGNDYFIPIYIDTGGPEVKSAELLSIEARHLDVGDGYVFGISENRLTRCDISNPDDPGPPSNWTFDEANIFDIDVEGDRIYHAVGPAGIRCLTTGIANYGRVFQVGSPLTMQATDDVLYVTDAYLRYTAVKSVDISNPAQATVMGEVLVDDFPSSLVVDGNRMVVGSIDSYIQAVDCSDPANLVAHDSYDTGAGIMSLAIEGNALYVGVSGSAIDLYNLTSWPAITFTATTLLLPASATLIKIHEGFMYAKAYDKIHIWSVFSPFNPTYLGEYTPLALPNKFELQGDYLYIATNAGLEIVDVSIPGSPTYVSSEPHPNAPFGGYIALEEQFAILQPFEGTPPTVMRIWPIGDPEVVGTLYDEIILNFPSVVDISNGYYYECRLTGIDIWDLY